MADNYIYYICDIKWKLILKCQKKKWTIKTDDSDLKSQSILL